MTKPIFPNAVLDMLKTNATKKDWKLIKYGLKRHFIIQEKGIKNG